jgi:adenosylcobinamide kinase/adenosylcobinamide-phosphate guanylyltransferase
MSNVHLILGGIRSGKSAYAERLVLASDLSVIYAATGQAFDAEMEERIRRHRQRRPLGWITLEEPLDLAERLGEALDAGTGPHAVIVESVDTWVANMFLEHEKNPEQDLEKHALQATDRLLDVLGRSRAPAFLVSSEVGLALVAVEPLGRRFQDTLGLVNQRVAQAASRVTLVVAGLPMVIKGPAGE